MAFQPIVEQIETITLEEVASSEDTVYYDTDALSQRLTREFGERDRRIRSLERTNETFISFKKTNFREIETNFRIDTYNENVDRAVENVYKIADELLATKIKKREL
ncbi:5832_t:CDS:2 [Dentiscutata erythropus]|uniref:5832_t:CDS:1 n=1 Tax=Dentiscutata erythropus TaxID=1348616 RepID=A0A9N9JD59_9GLOM|nr:5832_t:CDS:2 [Dentiscutata erythropus]